MILVTGGAGFIGSNFVLEWLAHSDESVVNLDLLTYAGNLENLASIQDEPRHHFVQGDIANQALVSGLLEQYQPRAVIHFAAESHVDRSIQDPRVFVETNILGTFNLLESVRAHWSNLLDPQKTSFRFVYVSTDEVYGSLEAEEVGFDESSQYQPNNPYSATKAAADHLVRAWHKTYGLPVITTHCADNYGPYHFPEKLIPLCIMKAIAGEFLPIYGDGKQVRDWLYVKDHCAAIRKILEAGGVGEAYNIGGSNEKTNLEVVESLCEILDELRPRADGVSYQAQITFVKDRPGHDRRYAIDATKLEKELGWKASEAFEAGLKKTVLWYLEHQDWVNHIRSGEYQRWVEKQYS